MPFALSCGHSFTRLAFSRGGRGRATRAFDIHKVKPIHGWREFIGEVGIIVLGVLIALGAEQIVEHWRASNGVREAERSMLLELRDDDSAQAYARLAISHCLTSSLGRLERQLLNERDGHVPFQPGSISAPPFRTWDNDAWRAAQSSAITSHMSAGQMYNWSGPYTLIGPLQDSAVREFRDWGSIGDAGSTRQHPSEVERERLLSSISDARRENQLQTFLSGKFIEFARAAGVAVPARTARTEATREAATIPNCHPATIKGDDAS